MFFVGAAVTLLIGMLVAFVIKIYKRRYQASNSSTNGLKGDSIKMQSQAPPQHPAKRQHKVLVIITWSNFKLCSSEEKEICVIILMRNHSKS